MDAVKRTCVVRQHRGSSRELVTGLPAPAIAPFVSRMVGFTEQTAGPTAHHEMPCSKVMIVIPIGPPLHVAARNGRSLTRFSDGLVAGVDDAAGRSQHEGFQCAVRFDLTPQGARRILGVPMSELAGQIVSLPDLLPPSQRDIAVRLSELSSWSVRFELLASVLAARLAASDEPQHAGIGWAAQRIEASGGRVDIGQLVHKLGYSHKHTLRLFREHIGMTPKLFARLVRFEGVRRAIRTTPQASLAELADRFGYSDQAHLVREVRHFAGASPTELRLSAFDVASR